MDLAKMLTVLVGVLAVMLVVAAPALAQRGQVSRTGVIERFEAEKGPPCLLDATHALDVVEGPGTYYILLTSSEGVYLDAYVGQRVTVYGEGLINPAVGGAERCPDIDVSRVELADPDGPTPNDAPETTAQDPATSGRGSGGSGSDGSGDSSETNAGGEPSGGAGDMKVLPATGGVALLITGVAGALLAGGGLLVCRFVR